MHFVQQNIELVSIEPIEIFNITDAVKTFIAESKFETGLLHIASHHTTMGLVINEECPKLRLDMLEFFKKAAPPGAGYEHDKVAFDGRPNAHSHLLGLMLTANQTLIVSNNRLELGTWQSIFAIELDGPRPLRKIRLSLLGMPSSKVRDVIAG